jgi:hypothetical protein
VWESAKIMNDFSKMVPVSAAMLAPSGKKDRSLPGMRFNYER